MKKYIKEFIYAILAGIAISIGCIVFLSVQNKVAGSILFALGLLTILAFRLNLFTGKAPYICTNKPKYIIFVGIVWLGNFVGSWSTAFLVKYTSVYNKIIERCEEIAVAKSSDNLLSLLILGVFCGILMFIAVDAFNKNADIVNFYITLLIIFCVSVFILSGFEHSIADMFYFMLALPVKTWIIPLLVISIGNILGGNIFCLICTYVKRDL